MSLETDLFDALNGLVSDRVYPLIFPQSPTWPAIRYSFISVIAEGDLCGDGGDATADTRVQIDIVAPTFDAMRTLRGQVLTAMASFVTPARWDGDREEFDADTKTYRASLDFVIYPSST